jgi:hypothetical protein
MAAALLLTLAAGVSAPAQDEAAPAAVGILTGPATIAPHWSPYDYPTEIGEGVPYYIIQKGDTLWDLSGRFLDTPYLWPQIWSQNPYITDAHWIYPGDPLTLRDLLVVSDQAGQDEDYSDAARTEDDAGRAGRRGAGEADELFAVSSPQIVQCSPYIVPSPEDEGIRIIGNDNNDGLMVKTAVASREIVYLSRGSDSGIQPGDRFTVLHRRRKVSHPDGGSLGWRIESVAEARVLLVQPDSAAAVIENACMDVRDGDYLLPYQERPVPYLTREPFADMLTPPSGKAQGAIVDFDDPALAVAAGHIVNIDLGSSDGVAPGTRLVAYRQNIPGVSVSRFVLGELAVLTVREETAAAAVLQSYREILPGDRIELK